MTEELLRAKKALANHSLALLGGGEIFVSDERGVAPLLKILDEGRSVSGYSAADKVVGKAAAMLFVKLGVAQVYAGTLSQKGEEVFQRHGVLYECEKRAERIINRDGTDTCPMEKAVWDIENIEEGISAIQRRVAELPDANPN